MIAPDKSLIPVKAGKFKHYSTLSRLQRLYILDGFINVEVFKVRALSISIVYPLSNKNLHLVKAGTIMLENGCCLWLLGGGFTDNSN